MDAKELDAYCAELVADPAMLERHAKRKVALDAYLLCPEAEMPAKRAELEAVLAEVGRH